VKRVIDRCVVVVQVTSTSMRTSRRLCGLHMHCMDRKRFANWFSNEHKSQQSFFTERCRLLGTKPTPSHPYWMNLYPFLPPRDFFLAAPLSCVTQNVGVHYCDSRLLYGLINFDHHVKTGTAECWQATVDRANGVDSKIISVLSAIRLFTYLTNRCSGPLSGLQAY